MSDISKYMRGESPRGKEERKLKKFLVLLGSQAGGERGAVSIGGIMLLAIAMVFLAVGFIFLPISTTATQSLLDYSYSSYPAITDATFTGFTSVVGITPLLILVGFLVAGVIVGMLGIKVMKAGGASAADPGTLILLGLSIVFISIGLIIEPITLDGVASALTTKDIQTNTENISTAVGQITGNVTLSYDPWNNSTAEVTSITSNVTETPAASTYNGTDKHLLLSGLTANVTHTITTTYNNAGLIDGTTGFTGYASILKIAPLLVHLAFVIAAVISGFFGIKRLAQETS